MAAHHVLAVEGSQAAGRAFISRITARTDDRDIPVGDETIAAYRAAARGWASAPADNFCCLAGIAQPALVVNGSNDIVIPTINSCHLYQHLPDAELMLLPDSGHAPTSSTSTASSAGSSTSSTSNRTTPPPRRDCLQRFLPCHESRRGICPAGDAAAGGRLLAGSRRAVPAVLRGGGPVAAVRRLPGPVAVLGDHADRRVRRLRSPAPGYLAGVRVAVGRRCWAPSAPSAPWRLPASEPA